MITLGSLTTCAAEARGTVVIIDVFRAFTTAAVALSNGAEAIVMVDDLDHALALRARGLGKVCMGERGGLRPEGFDYGNSPYEICNQSFCGDVVIQTTANGTKGIVAATSASSVYAASLVNAEATVRSILCSGENEVWLIAAGEGNNRTDEDEICALYMRALLHGRSPKRDAIREAILALSPRLDGLTLTAEDLAACLAIDSIPLAIRVDQSEGLCIARSIKA